MVSTTSTLPIHTSVKIDNPDSEHHGKVGFIRYNSSSGLINTCESHQDIQTCRQNGCDNAESLPNGWYELVFDPLDSGGFSHCKEWFHRDDLVINGC